MKKLKNNKKILLGLIIGVAFVDAFSASLGAVPILGDIIAFGGNILFEITELALIFGLIGGK